VVEVSLYNKPHSDLAVDRGRWVVTGMWKRTCTNGHDTELDLGNSLSDGKCLKNNNNAISGQLSVVIQLSVAREVMSLGVLFGEDVKPWLMLDVDQVIVGDRGIVLGVVDGTSMVDGGEKRSVDAEIFVEIAVALDAGTTTQGEVECVECCFVSSDVDNRVGVRSDEISEFVLVDPVVARLVDDRGVHGRPIIGLEKIQEGDVGWSSEQVVE
jgi:hypothetical protein